MLTSYGRFAIHDGMERRSAPVERCLDRYDGWYKEAEAYLRETMITASETGHTSAFAYFYFDWQYNTASSILV